MNGAKYVEHRNAQLEEERNREPFQGEPRQVELSPLPDSIPEPNDSSASPPDVQQNILWRRN